MSPTYVLLGGVKEKEKERRGKWDQGYVVITQRHETDTNSKAEVLSVGLSGTFLWFRSYFIFFL